MKGSDYISFLGMVDHCCGTASTECEPVDPQSAEIDFEEVKSLVVRSTECTDKTRTYSYGARYNYLSVTIMDC